MLGDREFKCADAATASPHDLVARSPANPTRPWGLKRTQCRHLFSSGEKLEDVRDQEFMALSPVAESHRIIESPHEVVRYAVELRGGKYSGTQQLLLEFTPPAKFPILP